MKRNRLTPKILFGLLLIALSVIVYLIHFLIFRDIHHIVIYLLGDIAFVFVEVLLVTLIIHQLLSEREKRAMLKKLNMVIGAFFNEVGTELLEHLSSFDKNPDRISKHLIIDGEWSSEHFAKVRSVISHRQPRIVCEAGELEQLREFIVGKRGFLLRLLENPNLLEHEEFTELLWAVFHLADELSHRKQMRALADSDYGHLAGDIKRVYGLLVREWLKYMEHLKDNYPYLFSLAVRTNPFDPEASVEVK